MLDFEKHIGDARYKILHFKGNSKRLMPGIGDVEIRHRKKT
jgi:hypothetical protein